MIITRRQLAIGAALGALGACSVLPKNPDGSVNMQQVVRDLMDATAALVNVIPQVEVEYPAILSGNVGLTALKYLSAAQGVLVQLGQNVASPATGSGLQTALGYFNEALTVLADLPIPPPYGLAIRSAAAIAPEVEQLLVAYFHITSAAMNSKVRALGAGISVDQARTNLLQFHS